MIELFENPARSGGWGAESFPFVYRISARNSAPFYEIGCSLPPDSVATLRHVVSRVSAELNPREVDPLTFPRLVEVLAQHAAQLLAARGAKTRVRDLAELAAYEAMGLSRIVAIAKDERVTEFFVDSDVTPVYLDHAAAGRCESGIVLTERERDSMETHIDTFSG